jgi:hypothetical protein
MVVSDTARALQIFQDHGTLIITTDVLVIEVNNKAGTLAAIAHKLANANINIEYCYSATTPNAKKGLLVLRASDAGKALKVLNT